MANNGLPPGATLVSGSLPSQPADASPVDTSVAQPSAAGLPPGAKLVSGTVPTPAAPAAPGTTGVSGVLNKIGEFGAGVAPGAVESMGETVQSLPWVGKKIISPEAMTAEREFFKPGSEAEKFGQTTGHIAEPILEFVLGDEALKGVALADKLGIASKIAKVAQDSPYIGKLLQHGVNAARMGTVGAVEAAAKGATLPEAIKTGVVTGLGGESLPVIGSTLNAVAPGLASKAAAVAAPAEEGLVARYLTNPFKRLITPAKEVGAAASAEPGAATSKIEPAVAARTAKAGLAPGEGGMTAEAARAATKQAALDAQAATQKNIESALQDIAGQHAKANGIPAPAAGTATRDVLTANGDALVDAGKANYKILDKYTDGKFTNTQAELKNAQQELRMKAGMTGVDTGDLEANVLRAQMKVDQLFDDAVTAGMPKDTAELARTQFKTGQATLDAANDVRMANRITGAGQRATNLNALENRWQARYDAGRLQQAFGEEGAKDALARIHAAREEAELFETMPPTESKALRELITSHTETGKFGTTTDWKGVRKEFSNLPDRAARFSDVPKVEQFINNQRFYQNLRRTGAGAVGAVAGGGLYEVGRKAIE